MKVFIAGPMTGIPHFNHPAFHEAEALLKSDGHIVFSPAGMDDVVYGPKFASTNLNGDEQEGAENFGYNRRTAMASGISFICLDADCVVLLPGWQRSRGALAEKAVAESLSIPVIEYTKFKSTFRAPASGIEPLSAESKSAALTPGPSGNN